MKNPAASGAVCCFFLHKKRITVVALVLRFGRSHWQRKPERASPAQLTAEANFSPHDFYQALGNI